MRYIDFHCHPAIKTFLGAYREDERDNCWKTVNVKGPLELLDKLMKGILDSQCSLKQITDGNVCLAIVGLYALERPMVYGEIKQVNRVFIDLLTISNFVNKLDYKLLGSVAFGEKGYFTFLNELKQHLINSKDVGPGFKILSSINDFDINRLNIIFTVEGSHALFHDVEHYTVQEVLGNLNQLKNEPYRYLFFTLAHVARNPLCNHAYGMKIIKHEKFIPQGDGIEYLGYEVIKRLLDTENNRRIYVDIKHMSLKARKQYYELLKNEYRDVPVIISHAGVTGVSYTKMPVNKIEEEDNWVEVSYKKPKGLMNTGFNPWSINLYDEEILTIIESNGIIGINLDERILGNKQNKKEDKTEYFSKSEFPYYNAVADENRYGESWLSKVKNLIIRFFTFRKDIKHLANNILHIIKVGGEKAWEHVCIGSDFDGMINPIETCRNARKFKKLERNLVKMLPKMAKSDPDTNYFLDNPTDRVMQLMYGNVKRFLDIYFL